MKFFTEISEDVITKELIIAGFVGWLVVGLIVTLVLSPISASMLKFYRSPPRRI